MIVLNQDILAYEANIVKKYHWGFDRLRLICIKYIQNWALSKAKAVIFLFKLFRENYSTSSGKFKNPRVIPHGVNCEFSSQNYY